MSGHCKCSVAFPRKAVGRSAVCDCGFSWSIRLRFLGPLELYNGRFHIRMYGKIRQYKKYSVFASFFLVL